MALTHIVTYRATQAVRDELQRVGKMVSNCKLELNKGPRYTAKIDEPPQGKIFNKVCDTSLYRGIKIGS